MKLGKPIKFVALKPEEVIERVKRNLLTTAKEKQKRLEDLKSDNVLDELSLLFTQGVKFVEPSDLSGSLRGRSNLYNHLDMLINGAEKTVTIVTTAEGLNRKIENLTPSMQKAAKRGVKVRIAAPITPKNEKIAKEMARICEVRNMKNFNARFSVIDSEQVMFMLLNDDNVHPSYDVGVWISTPFFAQSLEQMFELAWKDFKPVNGAVALKAGKK